MTSPTTREKYSQFVIVLVLIYVAGLLSGTLLPVACSHAPVEMSEADRELLDQALILDRVPDVLELQNKLIKQQTNSDPRFAKMPEDVRQKLTEITIVAFDPQRLQEDIANEVAGSFKRSKFEAFVRVYSTPIARKVGDLSISAEMPEAKAGMQSFVQEIQNNPQEEERVELLLQLDDLMQSSQIAAEVSIDLIGRMTGVSQDDPQYARMLEQARTTTRNSILMKNLYAYREMPVEEIREFVLLLRANPPVAEVSQSIDRATLRSTQSALRRFFQSMMELNQGKNSLPAPLPGQKQ
jgi:hypothetical protein